MKNAFCPRPLSHGSATLSFVISTEAQRSGEISVLTPLLGNVFRQMAAACGFRLSLEEKPFVHSRFR
jgi:hypothetical protein